MGLFSRGESIARISTEPPVASDERIRAALPDLGDHFLRWAATSQAEHDLMRAHIDALRGPDGFLPLDKVKPLFKRGRRYTHGPLSFLALMQVGDFILVEVWATYGLRASRSDKEFLKAGVRSVLDSSGHAAAATWVLASRPDADLMDVGFLGSQLLSGWQERVSHVTRRDYVKAWKQWETAETAE